MREGWIETTLGEIAEINPEATNGFDPDRPIRYVDLSAVTLSTGIDLNAVSSYRFREAPGRARRVIRADDVLVATVRPYLRGFARVPAELDREVASTGFAVLRARDGIALPGFIWAVVQTEAFVNGLMARATGSNYPAVRPADVAEHTVLLPPLAEQRRIVDLCGALESAARLAGGALEAVMRSRLSMLDNLLGSLEGAEMRLGEIAEIVMGQSPPGHSYNDQGEGLPFLQGSAEFGQRHPTPAHKWCSKPKKVARPGDLLVSVRAPVGDLNFAHTDLAVGRGLAIVRGTGVALTEFLAVALEHGRAKLRARAGGGMFDSVTKEGLQGLRIAIPPLDKQHRIVEIIDTLDAESEALSADMKALDHLRSGLHAELLSGEHEIPESYDALLEEAE